MLSGAHSLIQLLRSGTVVPKGVALRLAPRRIAAALDAEPQHVSGDEREEKNGNADQDAR
jgi:hypothetical protein